MGPAQFVTQCVTNWKCLINQPHITRIRDIESFPELDGEGNRPLGQQVRAVRGPSGAALFEFDDRLPHTPAGANLHNIDCTQGLNASALDELTKLRQQSGKIVRGAQSIAV